MMNRILLMDFTVNKETKTITVKREFAAEIPDVWDAFTKPEILDLWWAPKPWKTETKSMDFREGGHWLYAMKGPAGEVHWCYANYIHVNPKKSFTGLDGFSDAEGNVNKAMPQSKWATSFTSADAGSLVEFNITYDDLAQLEATLSMGFKEGFTMALANLDELLATNKI